MLDQYNRKIDYLRISVTDRCNFRCKYCMPEEGVDFISHREILSYEEIVRLTEIGTELGIRKIKITGGEPLVRKGVCGLIRSIRDIKDIESVTVTTNGLLLSEYLPGLKKAGVSGINISLDTLDRDRFYQITGRDSFPQVWKGFQEAVSSGIPVKINCVPMKGINDDQIADLAGMAKRFPICVRFIEIMPIGMAGVYKGIPQDEVRAVIENEYGAMIPAEEVYGNGPADYYNLSGFAGHIGFISAMSHEFCGQCNRVRLTADGILKPCLSRESHIDLKKTLRCGMTDSEIKTVLQNAIYNKPRKHIFGRQLAGEQPEHRRMSGIGG